MIRTIQQIDREIQDVLNMSEIGVARTRRATPVFHLLDVAARQHHANCACDALSSVTGSRTWRPPA